VSVICIYFVNASTVCLIAFLNYNNICSDYYFSLLVVLINELFQLTVNILFSTGYCDR
jgi:hypothetical protein